VPLSAYELLLLALVAYAALALPWPGARVRRLLLWGFAVVLAAKFALALAAPSAGLAVSYWAKESPDGLPEPGARVEQRLDLRGDEFAVHFFNDARRFNFGLEPQPGRDQLPFTARWEGWLVVPSDGERHFELEAMGRAAVWLDDAQLMRTEPLSTRQIVGIDTRLQPGLHALRVEYARPEARVPRLRLSWQAEPGGALQPIDARDTRWRADTADVSAVASAGGTASDIGIGLLVCAWLVLGAVGAVRLGRRRMATAVLAAVPLVFLVHGTLLHAPLIGRATILSGLDDWLVYESSARDILINGLLMDGGQGHAPPFYGQPLYPYVLAAAHWLTGESLFGPLVLQFAALGGVVALTAVLARQAFGSRLAGLCALAYAWLFVVVQQEHWRVARQLFNENLYMPLVLASLIVLVRLARRRKPPVAWHMLLVGALLGVTAITRSQFLAFVPLALVILALAWRRNALVPIAALVAGVGVAIAPVTVRNLVVSGELVPISTSGGASLLEFHRPPPGLVDPTAIQNDPLYEALRLDSNTRTVLEFARRDPLGYVATWLPLGAHSLGLPGRRPDAGIYWPLLVTVLVYLSAFGLRRTRRLHVWPIHAFVLSHLSVLMLFEADTYGYRLVVPMYAPMVAIAATVPLVAILRLRTVASRASRFGFGRSVSTVVATLALAGAIALQARGLADGWSQRETTLRGLGGAAAHAAQTADAVSADVVYVASIDGTPRRFGAGTLPGLRYPWFKWFDPRRTLPLAPDAATSVYALHELVGHTVPGDLSACLGPADGNAQVTSSGAEARRRCVQPSAAVGASFEGVARVESIEYPPRLEAGDGLEVRLVWRPLVAHPEPHQAWLHLVDRDAPGGGMEWGNATLELYPARLWEPGEALLSRLPVTTDATAIPDDYQLVLGMGSTRPNAAPLTAAWQGQRLDRVPVGQVRLVPGERELALAQITPSDMLPLDGPSLQAGGLELLAARPPAGDAFPGKRLRFGLLWRAVDNAPAAGQLRARLVKTDGQVVQESTLPLFGGRLAPSALRAGNVVRDEQELEIDAHAGGEALTLDVALVGADGNVSNTVLGRVTVAGRKREFERIQEAEGAFGEAVALLEHRLEPSAARAGENVTVHLRWQSHKRIERAYKIFVHVLDRKAEQVVAQRDAEPQNGRAPTTSWLPGEVLDDQFAVQLPAGLAAGVYSIEVGMYEERSGDRLLLSTGESRLILRTELTVR